MKGFGNLVKEAQKLQAQLETLKAEVGKRKVEASAGGGMVVVEANGNQELIWPKEFATAPIAYPAPPFAKR